VRSGLSAAILAGVMLFSGDMTKHCRDIPVTEEQIRADAKKFFDEVLKPKYFNWELYCIVCRGLNCKYNKRCIHCHAEL